MEFNRRQEWDGKVIVIECPRRIDASVADYFRSIMKELVDEGKYRLVVDLDGTEFMDSSGLGALVSRIATMRSNKGDIRLASPGEPIQKLLKITNLNNIFTYFDDVKSAVESFR